MGQQLDDVLCGMKSGTAEAAATEGRHPQRESRVLNRVQQLPSAPEVQDDERRELVEAHSQVPAQ